MRQYSRVKHVPKEIVLPQAALSGVGPATLDSQSKSEVPQSQEPVPMRRKKKKNFGVANQKLAVPEMPGYMLRWVNDTAGRIYQMQQRDWEFVDQREFGDAAGAEILNTDLGTRISLVVGALDDGSPLRSYLMKIRKEWYEEDQKEKQAPIDETDRSIYGGRFSEQQGDNRYIPSSGIKITTS